MRARYLETQLNQVIGTIVDLEGQVDGLLESIDGKNLSNETQVRSTAGQLEVLTEAESSQI